MAVSDGRRTIVDLTNDSESDHDGNDRALPPSLAGARVVTPRKSVSLPVGSRSPPSAHPHPHRVPLPVSALRNGALAAEAQSTEDLSRRPNGDLTTGGDQTSAPSPNYGLTSADLSNGLHMNHGSGRATKRLKIASLTTEQPGYTSPWTFRPEHGALRNHNFNHEPENRGRQELQAGLSTYEAATPTTNRNLVQKTAPVPSVQYMNEALKSASTTIPFLDEVARGKPRLLQISRMAHEGPTSQTPTVPHVQPVEGRIATNAYRHIPSNSTPKHPGAVPLRRSEDAVTPAPSGAHNSIPSTFSPLAQTSRARTLQIANKPKLQEPAPTISRKTFPGPRTLLEDDDQDSVMSEIAADSMISRHGPAIVKTDSIVSSRSSSFTQQTPSNGLFSSETPKQSQGRRKVGNRFSEDQEHYIIFLKEVKKLQWSVLTAEFNKDYPGWKYPTLQNHYSTVLNKRDRSLDPVTLNLPARYTNEATIDWPKVHANLPAASTRVPRSESAHHVRQSIEDDNFTRMRSRRAAPVDYTWPRRARTLTTSDLDETSHAAAAMSEEEDSVMGAETPYEDLTPTPGQPIVPNENPLSMDVDAVAASLTLHMRRSTSQSQPGRLPYLAASQRHSVKQPPDEWDLDKALSHEWQGTILHVDFSSTEIKAVHKAINKILGTQVLATSSINRRKLRDITRSITDPQCLRIVDQLRRDLPTRDKHSIQAFLQDVRLGKDIGVPHIYRVAAARPNDTMSTSQKQSTRSLLRQRELGRQSCRGWQSASKPISYKVKNRYMDTLGPVASWTGASSDIHAVAWSPDGESFAAAAVAVDDVDSMQYNRPNNLLFGNTSHYTIHELGEHFKQRQKTEKGANSTHAMFVSQDPKVYNTVCAVAFSASGRLMYSAGYDETVCIWHTDSKYTDSNSQQPSLGAKVNVKAQLDMLTVNPIYNGVLAVAAKVTEDKAIRLLTIHDEDNPSQFSKINFHSTKAVSRSDLKLLPTALRFEPNFGEHLLAGFGANVHDKGFDTTGDLCLWDIRSQEQLHIHGSNKNVFDIEFNPNRQHMPLFAAGCVAGANVNRGVRSLIRLYDLNGPNKYSCPLEIECKALDMNDVVWCPYDEYLIAAGCTDGKSYVWDLRWPNDPIHVLSHSRSLMPLQDGIKHEVTDTGVRFLSWGENATRLYSGSSDGVVKVWDVTRAADDTFVKDLVTFNSGIMTGAFSQDSSKLVLGEVNGSVNVLETGRDDCTMSDVERLRYISYQDEEEKDDSMVGPLESNSNSGIEEGRRLLQTMQLQTVAMGSLPVHQVVQGPSYVGPFDQSDDAPILRQQAFKFQLSLATRAGPQCDIPTCKDNHCKVTSEEIGDSGRSEDRIPDELRRAWTSTHKTPPMGLGKCSSCGRPARSSLSEDSVDVTVLCERCCFACFRCGVANSVPPATTTFICKSCAGIWDIGAVGYENIKQPIASDRNLRVPLLESYGEEVYLERIEDRDTTFGDEMGALTDHYFSLAIDRPESPPL
ncbi:hypothetical protein ACN47E_007017 [Coniothyrium glycines]